MPEVTHGESKALVISDISDITKLDSLNRESYKIICMNSTKAAFCSRLFMMGIHKPKKVLV